LSKAKYPWIVAGLILVWAIVATIAAAYYYNKCEELGRMYFDASKTLGKINVKLNELVDGLMEALENATLSGAFGVSSKIEDCMDIVREMCDVAGGTIKVNIGIDYGNGSRVWFNFTEIKLGETLLDATLKVAKVDYTTYPFGVFVNSIEGVANDPEKLMFWIWWYWDSDANQWKLGPVGCDKYVLSDGLTVIWCYESTAVWPPSPP